VQFSVSDTGTGIPQDELTHIFERFWRPERRDHGGAGLGLAISKGIVEAHNGQLTVESRVGEGSAFFFTLPEATDA
jgi:signal transduction histidine kinase